MYRIRKKFRFEGAHVLNSAFSTDCMRIHGHSYIVEVFIKGDTLNSDGMLIDFGELKGEVQHWINEWDHKLIVDRDHPKYRQMLQLHKMEIEGVDFNPTAEKMAKYLYERIGETYQVDKVRVHETETGYAEYWEE
jgi:6-pyruvoyltetrahydropterin/6-carboxytetrahydropterin synthase